MYQLSNFNQITVEDSSSMTWYITSLAKHILIVDVALVFESFQSVTFIPSGYFPLKAFTKPYYTNTSLTLICHNMKFPDPSNFIMLAREISITIAYALIPVVANRATMVIRIREEKIKRIHIYFTWFDSVSTSTRMAV